MLAAAGIAWQQEKSSDCCGIIGVVAHKDFDARYVDAEVRAFPNTAKTFVKVQRR
jgi:hypothetical protein